jgi:hypothetical protein
MNTLFPLFFQPSLSFYLINTFILVVNTCKSMRLPMSHEARVFKTKMSTHLVVPECRRQRR